MGDGISLEPDVKRSGGSPGAAETAPEPLRRFMSTYVTGVAVVTSLDDDGRPHGLTCTSLVSVTLTPPTLLVCLDVRTGTLQAVRASAGFAVNLLHVGSRRIAELFASPAADRFERVAWRPSDRIGLPRLVDDAYAVAECRVVDTIAVGDHAVVFGQVVDASTAPGSVLLYGQRAYGGRTGSE